MTVPNRVRLLTSGLLLASGGLLAAAAGCGHDPVAAPTARSVASTPAAARSATALAVSSTSPAFGDQGATVDVHVFGSGFAPGAQATWLLNGVADSHVHTNSTSYISASELVANITIAADAQLAFWDVQVSLSSGKNGVGSDCFEVTSAEVLGTTGGDVNVYGISEQLQVAGYATGGGFVYDDEAGLVNLGGAMVMAIDPSGTLAAGKVGDNFIPTIWVRQTAANWVAEQLPQLPHSVGARVQGAARTPDGTLLLAGLDDSALSTKPNAAGHNRVVLWRQTSGNWSIQKYTLPDGSVSGAARAVNGLAQIAGRLDAGSTGAVWEDAVTSTRLDGLPNAINAQGTLIVGERSGYPVYWWRDPLSQTWHTTGVPLPSIAPNSCTGGTANDVNSAGVIVGSSCNSAGKSQATVWLLDFSGAVPLLVGTPTALPGLGTKNTTATDVSSAAAVTDAAPYVVAGGARSNGTRLAVRWRLR
jgi:hypothetical protein